MHKEILVIDDNPDIRSLVSNILKDQNFEVRTAANYDQAVFEINKKLPDLAIIDIKLDKTGGLTEAAALYKAARAMDFSVMVGCMVGTSLAMAPAYLLCDGADFVDLDGPILIAQDRENGFCFDNGKMWQPDTFLWGMAK